LTRGGSAPSFAGMQDAARRENIQASVATRLRDRITAGRLHSGAPLSEVTIAGEFGVSRTPVREALKQLQTEGLVEIRPRVGTFVTAPTRLEVVELFELKEILEGAAARLLAQRGDVPELAALRRNVVLSEQAVGRGDVEAYALLVEEFHALIVSGAGNKKLGHHYQLLMNQLAYPRIVQTSLELPGRLERSDAEHRAVLEMIAAKDGTTAERKMREHVQASRQALTDTLRFAGEPAPRESPQAPGRPGPPDRKGQL
jgi:DNA-binding GntR family transcriptional regulator